MYWRAKISIDDEINILIGDSLTYYGYIDETLYEDWIEEVAEEVFKFLQENADSQSILFSIDSESILSRASVEIDEISKEFYDQKTSY